jgi:hypothetical protein
VTSTAVTESERLSQTIMPDRRLLMSVNWSKDADAALAQAAEEKRPLLIDFTAAPN